MKGHFGSEPPYQWRVLRWLQACFGTALQDGPAARRERAWRFLEEALELAQTAGVTKGETEALTAYTFGRPPGEIDDEVGGVMLTLAGFCAIHAVSMEKCGEDRLKSAWEHIDKIRAKAERAAPNQPLPGASDPK